MPLDMAQAIAQYESLGVLANSIPDLKGTLERGAAEEWTPDRFFAELQQTGWWKSSSETRRQAEILRTTDPATWQQTLHTTMAKIQAMAREMGVTMSGEDIAGTANHALMFGMDDNLLRNAVGDRGSGLAGQAFTGAAADLDRQLRETYSRMGLGLNEHQSRGFVNEILAGRTTLATYESEAQRQAKAKFGHLAEQIDQGMTVADIASPYISQMAQTLEIPETDIDLNDNYVQRALMDRDDKGQARTQPLWAFERALKDDPRWDKTKNAHNQYADMAARIGQDWGFA